MQPDNLQIIHRERIAKHKKATSAYMISTCSRINIKKISERVWKIYCVLNWDLTKPTLKWQRLKRPISTQTYLREMSSKVHPLFCEHLVLCLWKMPSCEKKKICGYFLHGGYAIAPVKSSWKAWVRGSGESHSSFTISNLGSLPTCPPDQN